MAVNEIKLGPCLHGAYGLVRGRVFRNIYKGHMDKTKGVWDQGWEVGMVGEGAGNSGGKMETTVLEQQ